MAVTTAADLRAAANLRRRAADTERHAHGDIAYRQYRSAVPGVGSARRVPGGPETEIRAVTEMRNGKELVHTSGFFTIYERAYPMWDAFGEYRESVKRGAGRETLASKPEVAFLTNHAGMAMARTTSGTLELTERDEGGFHDGWLNPKRTDVSDLVIAIDDKDMPEMSFAFMIPPEKGWWSEDFEQFVIHAYDIDRGDVSAVNFGANPYTDISARTAEVLDDIEHLPEGALRAAYERLQRRGTAGGVTVDDLFRKYDEVAGHVRDRVHARGPAPKPGEFARRLPDRIDRTVERFDAAEKAAGHNLTLWDMRQTPLSWYEIRDATGDALEPGNDAESPDAATVYIFDEIGGSFGVSAKQFAKDLEAISAPKINVRINSPGGSVKDATAIHSTLLAHPAKVTTWIDGWACSAASIIMLAADNYDPATDTGGVRMMPGSQTMVHKASTMFDGNDDDAERMAVFLRRQSENLAGMYAERAGGTAEEWMDLMTAETWSFAQETVDLGLADVVVKRVPKPAKDAPEEVSEIEERMRPERHTRALARFGYRYENREAAPAPQRRTTLGRPVGSTRVVHDADGPGLTMVDPEGGTWRAIDPKDQQAEQRSMPPAQMGRSIALIEAQLKASEHA